MDSFSFNRRLEEQRRQLQADERTKYNERQGIGSVIPPSFGLAAAAASIGLPFGSSTYGDSLPQPRNRNLSALAESLGLSGGRDHSRQSGGPIDYAGLIQRRFLEDQAQRDYLSQASVLSSTLRGLSSQNQSSLPAYSASAPAAPPICEASLVEEFIRKAFEQRALQDRQRAAAAGAQGRESSASASALAMQTALQELSRKRRRVEIEAAPIYIAPNSKQAKATFPLPLRDGRRKRATLGSLSSFKDKWNELEGKVAEKPRSSMNKAFIAELFARRLNERIDTVGTGLHSGEASETAVRPGLLKDDAR